MCVCFDPKGGYAFFETSFLPGQHQQLPRVQPKAWLKSPVYQATTPHGYCLRFSVILYFSRLIRFPSQSHQSSLFFAPHDPSPSAVDICSTTFRVWVLPNWDYCASKWCRPLKVTAPHPRILQQPLRLSPTVFSCHRCHRIRNRKGKPMEIWYSPRRGRRFERSLSIRRDGRKSWMRFGCHPTRLEVNGWMVTWLTVLRIRTPSSLKPYPIWHTHNIADTLPLMIFSSPVVHAKVRTYSCWINFIIILPLLFLPLVLDASF